MKGLKLTVLLIIVINSPVFKGMLIDKYLHRSFVFLSVKCGLSRWGEIFRTCPDRP
jgi:hypothetical protein